MTQTDIETLESELANAVKWKPAGDDFEKETIKSNGVLPEEKQEKAETKTAPVPNKEAVAHDVDKKSESKPTESKPTESKSTEGNRKNTSKALPSKKTLVQNNNFNNSGVNNSFNNNSGTIIIDKSIHIGETTADSTETEENSSADNKSAAKEDTVRANKENYQVAYDEGAQVAEDLIGRTTQTEKARAIRNIMKQNENTIIGFMQGYYSEDNVNVYGIDVPYGIGELLDQVDNEYGWTVSEKTRVFTKVMEATLKYAENTGNVENSNYKELAKLLNDANSGKKINTETADAYIKELIMSGAIDVNS